MPSRTMLSSYVHLRRRLHDQALQISGHLRAYSNVTLYRYSIKETDMKDQTKTLLETVPGISMYVNYPGDLSNLNANVNFIEDVLPVRALFPWYRKCGRVLKVDIYDEFTFTLYNELNIETLQRYEIIDRVSTYEEFHLEREFIIAPVRVSTKDMTDLHDNVDPTVLVPDGVTDDKNTAAGKDAKRNVLSDYD